MTKYTLVNVEKRNRLSPETFPIEPREAREKVGIGDLVKLIFEFELAGDRARERMWVEVTCRTDSGYEGALRNEPVHSEHGLSFDDAVQFGPEHIAQAECPHKNPEKEHARSLPVSKEKAERIAKELFDELKKKDIKLEEMEMALISQSAWYLTSFVDAEDLHRVREILGKWSTALRNAVEEILEKKYPAEWKRLAEKR